MPDTTVAEPAIRKGKALALSTTGPISAAEEATVLMDEAESRRHVDLMRSDLARADESISNFRQRALEWQEREGWRALGYNGFIAGIQGEFGVQWSKSYISRLLKAAKIERALELPMGNSPPERPLREIAALETPAEQRAAWDRATELAGGSAPTVSQVKQAVAEKKLSHLPPDFADAQRRAERSGLVLDMNAYGIFTLLTSEGFGTTIYDWPDVLRQIAEKETARTEDVAAQPFWQAISPAHPTAHLWTQTGPNVWRAACGAGTAKAPGGSRDGGHCSSCVRATWKRDDPGPTAGAGDPAHVERLEELIETDRILEARQEAAGDWRSVLALGARQLAMLADSQLTTQAEAIEAVLTLADDLAGFSLEALAAALDDASYEALARYRRDDAESEAIE
jgi:hypothetical protein